MEYEPAEDPILAELLKPLALNEPREYVAVADFLATVKVFSHVNDRSVVEEIARHVSLKQCIKGETIFREGDIGEHFYIVLDGEVSIFKMQQSNKSSDVEVMNVLVKLFRGQTFGDTALETRAGRSAGAMASQPTNLLMLHGNDYQRVMGATRVILRQEVKELFHQGNIFGGLPRKKRDILESSVIMRAYAANSVIFKQGDPAKYLYVVKQGVVSLVKSIPRPQAFRTGTETYGVTQDPEPDLWVLDSNWKDRLKSDAADRERAMHTTVGSGGRRLSVQNKMETAEFIAGVLGSGQIFGELAVLDPSQPSPLKAVCFTSVDVYCFESSLLIALGVRFDAETMTELQRSLNFHNPQDGKLDYYFKNRLSWEKARTSLLKQIKQTQYD
jgi:CRP-like cAMP-binding protein